MRCHYKISKKKEKKLVRHTKYYQKHLNSFGIFNFKQIVTSLFCFSFLLLLLLLNFFFSHKQREEEKMVWCRKRKSTRSEEERKQHDGKKKLKHAVHDLRINAHKYKSSKRQIARKLRINNKLVTHGGGSCVLTYCQGILLFIFWKEKFHKIKAPFFFNLKRIYTLN